MPFASVHNLEQDLKALRISHSKEESNSEQWVPAKRKKGIPQLALVRPLPAANGHRQLFGFPITLDDLKHLATIAFNHLRPGEALDTPTFMFFNFPTFIQQSLHLPICTVARGQVDGPSENIPSECMATPTTVQLLVVWKDTDSDDYCPTQRQVRILERKIRRPPGWWVDYHHPHFWDASPPYFLFLSYFNLF
ncbi:hypothetical protein P692DRAFT_20879199 [Suillus brevipes Sb2]|nr:hypothetical protein P692DRAFT_20879199 [Suillus brevipes Sb2]